MDVAEYIRRQNAKVEQKSEEQISYKDAINKYANYSEEELMSELFRLGSLSTGRIKGSDLDDFYKKVNPYLTPEQRERMKELIIGLKNS